ncbi:MAG: hypothetical protein Q9219_006028 [cf. Caloplaca sp. 3 TL-2023]
MSSPPPSRGISFHVTITVDPSNADEFLRRSKPTLDLIAAEPLCLFFQVFQAAAQPGRFKIVENWKMTREQFFNEQMTKAYYKPYEEATKPLWIEERTGEAFDLLPTGWARQKEENVG